MFDSCNYLHITVTFILMFQDLIENKIIELHENNREVDALRILVAEERRCSINWTWKISNSIIAKLLMKNYQDFLRLALYQRGYLY